MNKLITNSLLIVKVTKTKARDPPAKTIDNTAYIDGYVCPRSNKKSIKKHNIEMGAEVIHQSNMEDTI